MADNQEKSFSGLLWPGRQMKDEVYGLWFSDYYIDPEMNNIRRAKFSIGGVAGLLNKYDIIIE